MKHSMVTWLVLLMLVVSATGVLAIEAGLGVSTDTSVRLRGEGVRNRSSVQAGWNGTNPNTNKGGEVRGLARAIFRQRMFLDRMKDKLHEHARELAEFRLTRLARLEEKHANASDFVGNLSDEEQQVFIHLGRAHQEQIARGNIREAHRELAHYKVEVRKADRLFAHREIAQEHAERAEEHFEAARERYERAGEKVKDAREGFEKAKKNGNSTEALARAKEYLSNAADRIISSLEKVKARVDANPNLNDNESAVIIAEIDARIALVEDARVKIEAATTKQELKDAAKTLLDDWHGIKGRIAVFAGRLQLGQVGEIIERGEHLEDRFDCVVSSMESQNISTADLQDKMDNFSALIQSAREKHDLAREKWAEAKSAWNATAGDKNETLQDIKEARTLLKDAQGDLKDAHALLMDIVRDVRQSGGNLGACRQKDSHVDEDEDTVVVDTSANATVEVEAED